MLEFPELERLENDFSVAEVIPLVGASMERYQGRLFLTSCPSCNSDAWVLPTGLYCNAFSCSFTAGGPVEYLVAKGGYSDVNRAIAELEALTADRDYFWDATDPHILKDALGQQLVARRALFNFFLHLGQRETPRGEICLLAEYTDQWRRHLGSHQLSVFHASRDDLRKLRRFFKQHRIDTKIRTDHPLILIPFFEHHHSISAIMTYCPESKRSDIINLRPAQFAFSGLLNSSPAAKRTYLLGNPVHALQAGERVSLHSRDEQVLGMLYDHTARDYAYVPENAVYCMLDDEAPGFAAAYRKASPKSEYVLGAPPHKEAGQPWWEFLLGRLCTELRDNDGVLTPSSLTLAQGADLTPIERHQLCHVIGSRGYVHASKRLSRLFSTRTLLRQKNLSLLETPSGYVIRRDGHVVQEQISNFAFHLQYNLLFEDSRDLFHVGDVLFQGKNYPVVVSSDDLNSAQKLQDRIQQAIMHEDEAPENLPIIRDRSLFKYVSLVLREHVSSLKSKPGVAAYGWHHSRKKYTAPRWKMELDGTFRGPFKVHPDRPVLGYFDGDSSWGVHEGVPQRVPSGLADIARIALAGVFREFCSMPMQGVPVKQTRAAQRAIEIVFRQLGQVRPVNSMGPRPVGLNRFPAYGFEHSLQQLRQSENFIFGLGDHGLNLHGLDEMPEQDLADFGDWLDSAIMQLAEHLVAIGPQEFERQRHILFVNELISEGDKLLQEVFHIKDWVTKPVMCEATEQLLDRVSSPANLGEFFAYDYANQKVRIFHKRHNDSEKYAHALELELRRLASDVAVFPDYMTAESPAIHNVLRHYYDSEVRIPELVTES